MRPAVDMRFAAEEPNHVWPFNLPDIPDAIITDVLVLIISQMEVIKEDLFAGTYVSAVSPEYSGKGYTVSIDADVIALGMQKITIIVYFKGDEVWELEGYKSDR